MKILRPKPEARAPGELPKNRIPIYDHAGNMRGHVTAAATGATVARFLGRHGADLTKKDGRDAWVGHKPPPPPPPEPMPELPPHEAARSDAEIGLINAKAHALAQKKPADKPKLKPKGK